MTPRAAITPFQHRRDQPPVLHRASRLPNSHAVEYSDGVILRRHFTDRAACPAERRPVAGRPRTGFERHDGLVGVEDGASAAGETHQDLSLTSQCRDRDRGRDQLVELDGDAL